MPDTCEKLLGLVNNYVYYAHQTRENYQVLPWADFNAPQDLCKPLTKTVFSKCNFGWNEGHVNIWNDHKAQK